MLLVRALELDDTCVTALNNLGAMLPFGASVHLRGRGTWSQADLFKRAMELDASNAAAMCNLGAVLGPQENADLPNGLWSSQSLFLKALEFDPTLATAYCNLGTALVGPGSSVRGPDGSTWTQQ